MGSEFVKALEQRAAPRRAKVASVPDDAARDRRSHQPAAHSSSLVVGAVDDPLEREADRAAEWAVARMRNAVGNEIDGPTLPLGGTSRIRRSAGRSPAAGAAGGPVDAATESRIRRAEAGGVPLEPDTRMSFEGAFTTDFSAVRIHRNSALAPELGAVAFTHGAHIHFADGQYAPGTTDGQRLLGHELAHVVQQPGSAQRRIRRSIGIEMEIVDSTTEKGVALSPLETDDDVPKPLDCDWERRDVIVEATTWDLTLDDTPGTAPQSSGREYDNRKYRKFNLEFILHGGAPKKGFPDDGAEAILAAIHEIEELIDQPYDPFDQRPWIPESETTGRNSELQVYLPTSIPDSANIQLTAGTSLAGLQALFEANHETLKRNRQTEGSGEKFKEFESLVSSDRTAGGLALGYVAPKDVAAVFGEGVKLSEKALRALSSLFSILKAFMGKVDAEMKRETGANVKEATPLLWKTPLNLVLQSKDFSTQDREAIKGVEDEAWLAAVVKLVTPDDVPLVDEIKYVPDKPVNVRAWLKNLRSEDLLTKADEGYNKSFGGIGVLEGPGTGDEAQPSANQPIIEFRAVPSTWDEFKQAIEGIVAMLKRINT